MIASFLNKSCKVKKPQKKVLKEANNSGSFPGKIFVVE